MVDFAPSPNVSSQVMPMIMNRKYEVKTNALCGYDACLSVTSYQHVVCLIFVKFGTSEGTLYKVLYSK